MKRAVLGSDVTERSKADEKIAIIEINGHITKFILN